MNIQHFFSPYQYSSNVLTCLMPVCLNLCLSVVFQAVCICSLHWGVHLSTIYRADLSLLYPGTVRSPSLIPIRGLPEFPPGHHWLVLSGKEPGTVAILLCPLCRGELLRWAAQFRNVHTGQRLYTPCIYCILCVNGINMTHLKHKLLGRLIYRAD